jgi:hypothetical protein
LATVSSVGERFFTALDRIREDAGIKSEDVAARAEAEIPQAQEAFLLPALRDYLTGP